jgi:hypothetical protein
MQVVWRVQMKHTTIFAHCTIGAKNTATISSFSYKKKEIGEMSEDKKRGGNSNSTNLYFVVL